MRPDLNDVLSGVQRLLQSEVSPALPDPFLQEQVAYASLLLEYVKTVWPREHLALAEEHADLAACLEALAPLLEGLASPEGRALAADLRQALARQVVVAETPLDRILEVDRGRRALLERTVVLLDRHSAGGTDDPSLAAERAVIDAYLVRAAARRDAVLRALGLGW